MLRHATSQQQNTTNIKLQNYEYLQADAEALRIMNLSCALCLEEHTDDRHHREAAVCQLGRELFGLLSRIRGGQHLEAIVTGSSALVVIESTAELYEAKVRGNLRPAGHGHLGDSRKAVRDVGEPELFSKELGL